MDGKDTALTDEHPAMKSSPIDFNLQRVDKFTTTPVLLLCTANFAAKVNDDNDDDDDDDGGIWVVVVLDVLVSPPPYTKAPFKNPLPILSTLTSGEKSIIDPRRLHPDKNPSGMTVRREKAVKSNSWRYSHPRRKSGPMDVMHVRGENTIDAHKLL